MTYESTLTCPGRGDHEVKPMPANACVWFRACGSVWTPHPGDCCVFCSYGSIPCPPRQLRPADTHCDQHQ
ncbi:MAG: GDCCVxC domain-containing (seleno)protein [Rhodanobacteraceae bacterium]